MKAIKTAALLVFAAASANATGAFGQTIAYTSYGAKYHHDNTGPTAAGTAANRPAYLPAGYIALAASFVPTVSGDLNEFVIALNSYSGLPAATVTLVADNGAGAPDLSNPVMETIIIKQIYPKGNTVVHSVAKPALTAGTTYWIIVTPAAYDEELVWWQSATVNQSVIYTANGGQSFSGYTSHQAAFDVLVTPGS